MKRILVVAVAAILAWCGFTLFLQTTLEQRLMLPDTDMSMNMKRWISTTFRSLRNR